MIRRRSFSWLGLRRKQGKRAGEIHSTDLPPMTASRIINCARLEDRVLYSASPVDPAMLNAESDSPFDGWGAAEQMVVADGTVGGLSHISLHHDHEQDTAPADLIHDDLNADVFGHDHLWATDLDMAESEESESENPTTVSGPIIDLSETFSLHSNPGAAHTIHLDFDGHTTSGTPWNAYTNGDDFVTPAYDIDGDTSSFSDLELERIQYIWQRVAEDFIPFDVDVTTEDPGIHALTNSGAGDETWGVRTVIGGSSYDWFDSGAGGVALYGSFDVSTDTPVYVFEDRLGGHEKYVADTASHEIGHSLNLGHDGTTELNYYSGHGSGPTGWGPIMGTTRFRELTQWSKGEYPNANNDTDDLLLITTSNGFGYRADDHGDSFDVASFLAFAGDEVTDAGIIEQNTDVDVFSFVTDGGLIDLQIDPLERGANLDILAELYDANNNLIVASNPLDFLDADIYATVDAGQYFLTITGTGKYDPDGYGYSDYGSLGQYFISGSIAPGSGGGAAFVSIDTTTAVAAEGDAGTTELKFTVTRTGNTAIAAAVDFAVSGSGANAAQASDFVNGTLPTGTVNFAAGETTKTISVFVAGDLEVEADEAFTVTLANPTADTFITAAQADGTIVNDDVPETPNEAGIAVTPVSGLVTDETGTQASFSVVLNSRPTTDVIVQVSSQDTSEGRVNVNALTFTADNWNQTQFVFVTGVDDTVLDGNVGYTVRLTAAQSGDAAYNGLDPDDVRLVNEDDEQGEDQQDSGKGKSGTKGGNNKGKGKGPKKNDATLDGALAAPAYDDLAEDSQLTRQQEQRAAVEFLLDHVREGNALRNDGLFEFHTSLREILGADVGSARDSLAAARYDTSDSDQDEGDAAAALPIIMPATS